MATAETRIERPAHAVTQVIDIDDLPSGPTPTRRDPDQLEILRYQLHRVEAQATSLGRELVASGASERALHLVTATIRAARTALRTLG